MQHEQGQHQHGGGGGGGTPGLQGLQPTRTRTHAPRPAIPAPTPSAPTHLPPCQVRFVFCKTDEKLQAAVDALRSYLRPAADGTD